MFIHLFCCFVGHKGQFHLISISGQIILKRRDNRQLQIHVSEAHIRRQLILSISYPLIPPCLCLQPPTFSCCTNYRSTPLCVEEQGFGGAAGGENFIGPEPNNLINIAPLAPFSFFLSLFPPSVFRL